MAVVRARLSSAACVLASATPSLESTTNAATGRYAALHLPARHGGGGPARCRADRPAPQPARTGAAFLSPPLVDAVTATLARGGTGHAVPEPPRLCTHDAVPCLRPPHALPQLHRPGWSNTAPSAACNATIAAMSNRPPEACPQCGATHSTVPIGPGVERVLEEATALWPEARRLVMASDTIPGPAAAAAAAAQSIQQRGGGPDHRHADRRQGAGTSPHLTLVGVVDADLGLAGGDLRAAERTFQLLHQVAGRAAVRNIAATSCCNPSPPNIRSCRALISGDVGRLHGRRGPTTAAPGHWPPFGRLAALVVSSEDERAADRDRPRPRPHRAGAGRGWRCSGPHPRHSPSCAAGTAAGCCSRRGATSRCSRCCRPGSPRRRCPAMSGCRWMWDPVGFL
jgi:primosomal protein N' (replication factor Y)